jgi:hypothetical protein
MSLPDIAFIIAIVMGFADRDLAHAQGRKIIDPSRHDVPATWQ